MHRRTFTGTLVAASLAAGALLSMPAAQAAPTWVGADTVSGPTFLPAAADVAVADNGDAVATWLAGGRVLAASASHGAWGLPKFVSDPGKVVSTPVAAVNDHGDAVVAWGQKDMNDNVRLAVSRRLADQTWDGWGLISPVLDKSMATTPVVRVDGHGTVRAAYVASDGNDYNQVRVSTLVKGSNSASTTAMSDTDAFAPSLDVTAAGAVQVSWMDVEGAQSLIRTSRLPAGSNTWGTIHDAGAVGSYLAETATAISDSGFATVAFVESWNGDLLAKGAKVQADGSVGSPSIASEVGRDASQVSLDQNADGTALLSWVYDNGDLGYATRKQTSGWVKQVLDAPVASPNAPRSAIADNGSILIGYVGNQHLLGTFDPAGLLPATHVDSGDQDIVTGSTLMGMDAQGNAFLGAVRDLGAGQGEVRGAFLDAAGPSTTVATPAQVLAAKFTVTWAAVDRLSSVTAGSVRVRSAAFDGGFGGYTYPQVAKATTALSFTGTPGRTYCFSAQAKDSVGNLGAWSAERCTTVPLDDRSLTRKKGFKKAAGAAHYLGTYAKATKKGATLRLGGVVAEQITLVVARAPKAGKVKVTFAGQVLGTHSLKGTGTKKLLTLKHLGSVRTGTLVVKVVSKTGKVVKIDGVVATR